MTLLNDRTIIIADPHRNVLRALTRIDAALSSASSISHLFADGPYLATLISLLGAVAVLTTVFCIREHRARTAARAVGSACSGARSLCARALACVLGRLTGRRPRYTAVPREYLETSF